MTEKSPEATLAALDQAKDALAKLPILGPALWLYARDPMKKFMFLADTDWAVLPPIVLDQCRLYTNASLPYAFITWAFVNDTVDARLRSGHPKIAPHEWNSGEHLWIIDAVAPFGQLDTTLKELRETVFPGRKVSVLLSQPNGTVAVQEWAPTGTGQAE